MSGGLFAVGGVSAVILLCTAVVAAALLIAIIKARTRLRAWQLVFWPACLSAVITFSIFLLYMLLAEVLS